jgi:YihY family inner membrane protein
MSTATAVPETFELEGDDAMDALRSTGWMKLLKDSFTRFRAADGTSHSRALAYQIALTSLPGVIAVVGFATFFNQSGVRRLFEKTATSLAPGPAGQIFHQAFHQGSDAAKSSGLTALIFGLVATVVAATFAMAQIERGANRIYGVEADRPSKKKYGVAFILAVSAGLMSVIAFGLFVTGGAIANSGPSAAGWSDTLVTIWQIVRWPLAIVLIVAAISLILRKSPHRHQPQLSWLAVGASVAVVLWILFTLLLAFYLGASKSFGQTYGPLAGILGLLLWSFLTSLALFLGVSFAAQLEAVRAGVPQPRVNHRENLATNLRTASRAPG